MAAALVKRSRKNQVALPKAILEEAGLGADDVYFSIACEKGAIVLRPVEIEEKVPEEILSRFKAKVVRGQRGDRSFSSMEGLIRDLKKRR